MEIRIDSLDQLHDAAVTFLKNIGGRRVFAFHADMGAGKTTFIAEVCRCLGVNDDSASPTFSIVNEYSDKDGTPVYHFDFYRIDSPQEALDIGVDDYFDSGCFCFIEWPDRLDSLLPDDAVDVYIDILSDNSRVIRFLP